MEYALAAIFGGSIVGGSLALGWLAAGRPANPVFRPAVAEHRLVVDNTRRAAAEKPAMPRPSIPRPASAAATAQQRLDALVAAHAQRMGYQSAPPHGRD